MRAKGMKNLSFIIPQEAKKPFVAPAAPGWASRAGPSTTRTPIQGRMSDREIDQQLVERAQRGDKRAFELLVIKYQRKLERLLSRIIRDPAEIEDVAQEAFIKAYRALPNFRGDSAFYTWLYRIGINTAKNYLIALGRRAPTSTEFDSEEAEGFEDATGLRDINTPGERADVQADRADGERRDRRPARGAAHRDHAARARRPVVRGDRADHELPDRHRPVADIPGARGGGREAAPAARDDARIKRW